MKMNIEEKAKRYDEAFRIAQELYNDPNSSNVGKGYVCTIFPKLKEGEDERIRKEIIYFLSRNTFQFGEDIDKYKSWIAWLEKQGEQKPAWSEEDVEIIEALISLCDVSKDNIPQLSALKNWLKSLRPQKLWKPSEEQMNALDSILQYSQVSHSSYEHLNSLFNDLKKLKE